MSSSPDSGPHAPSPADGQILAVPALWPSSFPPQRSRTNSSLVGLALGTARLIQLPIPNRLLTEASPTSSDLAGQRAGIELVVGCGPTLSRWCCLRHLSYFSLRMRRARRHQSGLKMKSPMHQIAVVAAGAVGAVSRGWDMMSKRTALAQLGSFVVRDLCIVDPYSHTALPTPMRR